MRRLICAALILGAALTAVSASAEAPKQLEPLAFLIGEWETIGGAKPENAAGSAMFARYLQDRVIIRRSFAEYPATTTSPAARHDDLMVIYAAEDAGIRADYYDNEGHVIRYIVNSDAPGEVSLMSEIMSGIPRFRLTYSLGADGILKGEFLIAPPGAPEAFAPYLAWESRKAAAGGNARP